MPPVLTVHPPAARRFLRVALGLDTPHRDVAAALTHHGYIQIDPINVCGRMHDLILRNRVAGYREGDLYRHLHGADTSSPPTSDSHPAIARVAFEHHLPRANVLVAFPLDAWPHLLAEMRARSRRTGAWSGRLTPRELVLAGKLLDEIRARGPLGAEDFEDKSRRARRVWGSATLVKSTLQKLFFHGRVLIARRRNNRRCYDIPERVLPGAVLGRPEASATETARWLALLKLRQRRLATLKREEFRLVEDAVQPIAIENCPPLYCLRDDVPLLESAMAAPVAGGAPRTTAGSASPAPPRLLAPLDPLIYDRRVTSALWGFDYTWEVYTPAPKRVRGYYALPVLAGLEIVGHVDPKADRASRKLSIVSRRLRRGHGVATALRDFARWLGLRTRRAGINPPGHKFHR